MHRIQMIVLAFALAVFSEGSFAQDTALPKSAKLTKDNSGKVTEVRIVGESDRNRLAMTPEAIKALAEFTDLEYLSLWGTTVGDDDIRRLASLANLQAIDLSYTDVTGKSIRSLSSLKKLAYLRLEGCDVKDEHLAPLARMPQVSMLYLGRTKVTDAGLKHLRGLKDLNVLQLSDCKISDEGLASLGDFPIIQHLWLSKTIRYGEQDRSDLTDACVDYLTSLDTLIDLQISDSQLTQSGLQKLQEGLPKAEIYTKRTGITYVNAKKK